MHAPAMPGEAVAVTRPASDEMLVAEPAGRADEEPAIRTNADLDPGFPGFLGEADARLVDGFRLSGDGVHMPSWASGRCYQHPAERIRCQAIHI